MSPLLILTIIIAFGSILALVTCSIWVWHLKGFRDLKKIKHKLKHDRLKVIANSITVHELSGKDYIGDKICLYHHVLKSITSLLGTTIRGIATQVILLIMLAIIIGGVTIQLTPDDKQDILPFLGEVLILFTEVSTLFIFYIKVQQVGGQIDRYSDIIDEYKENL